MSEVAAQPAATEAAAQATTAAPATQAIASAETPAAPATKEAQAAQPVVPEKYDLKAPDGSYLNPKQLEAVAEYSKGKKLTAEQAQELVNREHGAIKSFVEAQQAELKSKSEQWGKDARADKEIGGERFGEVTEGAKRVLAKIGNPTITKFLEDTGYGNHPDVIRMFAKLIPLFKEDTLVLPGSQATGTKSTAELFYGKKEG